MKFLAAVCHGLALVNAAVFLDVLFLGGFRFRIAGLVVSATHLPNPLLLALGFTLLGKVLNPRVPFKDLPLFRMGGWLPEKVRLLKTRDVSPLLFWISFLFLNSLLFLPPMLAEMEKSTLIPFPPLHGERGWWDALLFFFRRENHDLFRLSGELLSIATLVAVTRNARFHRWGVRLGLTLYIIVLTYQIYESLSLRIFGEKPLFYSDILLVRDAAYLVMDLWSSRLLDTAIRVAVWSLLIGAAIGLAFRFISRRLERLSPFSPTAILGMAVWPVVLFSTFWYDFHDPRPTVRWVAPRIAENLGESVKGMKSLPDMAKSGSSSYAGNRSVKLTNKPNLFIFLIESYGKVLAQDPRLKEGYIETMNEARHELAARGWHVATNYSRAPISGGKSWLSMGTVLTGLRMENQAIYSLLLRSQPDYPHLVRFLKSQGYTTAVLQPTMRPRPGFSFDRYEAFFDFDLWIYQAELDYSGDHYGWGMIPDQYSLNYAHEKFIRSLPEPFCLMFETVSSHSPWYDLPPYVGDWKRLAEAGFHAPEHARYAALDGHWPRTWKKLSHHLKKQLGLKDVFRVEDYMAHMNYQIAVITDYVLEKAPPNSLFLLVGDHQPPVITGETGGFETPVHVISRDRDLVRSLTPYGFVPGMFKDAERDGSIRHEAIYSLLVRVLAGTHSAHNPTPLPPYRPEGVPLSVFRR